MNHQSMILSWCWTCQKFTNSAMGYPPSKRVKAPFEENEENPDPARETMDVNVPVNDFIGTMALDAAIQAVRGLANTSNSETQRLQFQQQLEKLLVDKSKA
uniref:(northern house mosquito) hypothetical protein n=1 Tax=Culex pipiens TaxID=7175 RepID=A0A8D8DPE0_CULPI